MLKERTEIALLGETALGALHFGAANRRELARYQDGFFNHLAQKVTLRGVLQIRITLVDC
jgi:hypothetical protein